MNIHCYTRAFIPGLLALLLGTPGLHGQGTAMDNGTVRMYMDLNGGKITSMKLSAVDLNPVHAYGHFICFDRWGPSSEEDQALGIPQHGNASRVQWSIKKKESYAHGDSLRMACTLPVVGLKITRNLFLGPHSSVFHVEEVIDNPTAGTKPVNLVQHPTIGRDFLDESTIVDTHVDSGFSQSGTLPPVPGEAYSWPHALLDGKAADLRYLSGEYSWWQEVLTFITDQQEEWSWVTAVNPARELLLGYLWPTADYRWLNLWFNITDNKPYARGLEFGTSGLHQPWPEVLAMDSIFNTPLYEELQPGASTSKRYYTFMARVPADYQGVEAVVLGDSGILIDEYGADPERRIQLLFEGENPALGLEPVAAIPVLEPGVSPNPFVDHALIQLQLPVESPVELRLISAGGQLLRMEKHGPLGPGVHHLQLEGENLTPGVYVCEIRAAGMQRQVRLIRARQ